MSSQNNWRSSEQRNNTEQPPDDEDYYAQRPISYFPLRESVQDDVYNSSQYAPASGNIPLSPNPQHRYSGMESERNSQIPDASYYNGNYSPNTDPSQPRHSVAQSYYQPHDSYYGGGGKYADPHLSYAAPASQNEWSRVASYPPTPTDEAAYRGANYQANYRNSSLGASPGEAASYTGGQVNAGQSLLPQEEQGQSIPKALHDPNVVRQLQKRKVWRPWFTVIVTAIQIIVMILAFVRNQQLTGSPIATQPVFNIMIGPQSGTLINMGARFVPCMRLTDFANGSKIVCPWSTDLKAPICTLEEICGLNGFPSGKPDQWYRFITPIFLHGGAVHLLFNLMFQIRTGAQMERDMGIIPFALIYMASGIAGFIFGANFAPVNIPSMGASGALFGLIGCLVLDLIQNWKLVVRPCWELTKMLLLVLFSFALGLLPWLDNFSHIGGFFTGILAGLIFMPTIHFSKLDKRIKWGLRILAIPLLFIIFYFGITNFYSGRDPNVVCPWCKYLSCIPVNNWCDPVPH